MKINRRRRQPDGKYKDENTVLTIDIKRGWKEGTKITFHNEGSEKPGTSAGDVVFKIKERFLDNLLGIHQCRVKIKILFDPVCDLSNSEQVLSSEEGLTFTHTVFWA